jgi:hypothetical protein
MQALSSRPHYSRLNRPIKDDLFTHEYDENGNLIKKVEKATGKTTPTAMMQRTSSYQ